MTDDELKMLVEEIELALGAAHEAFVTNQMLLLAPVFRNMIGSHCKRALDKLTSNKHLLKVDHP